MKMHSAMIYQLYMPSQQLLRKIKSEKKTFVQRQFREQLGLIIDKPKQQPFSRCINWKKSVSKYKEFSTNNAQKSYPREVGTKIKETFYAMLQYILLQNIFEQYNSILQ